MNAMARRDLIVAAAPVLLGTTDSRAFLEAAIAHAVGRARIRGVTIPATRKEVVEALLELVAVETLEEVAAAGHVLFRA